MAEAETRPGTAPPIARPLRVAVLGTAHVHLPDHLAAIEQHPDARLAALHPGEPPWRTPVPGAPLARTPAQALSGADAAVLASTTAENGPLLELALAAGVPVLAEKPLGADPAETAGLVAAIEAAAVPATTAMFLRRAPALRRVRTLLAEGALGPVVSGHLRFSHAGLADGVFTGGAGWMLLPEHGGRGGFADLALHLVDLLRWLDPSAPLGMRARRLRHHGRRPLDVGGTALLDWGGATVSVHAGWTVRPGGTHLHLEGEEGSVTVDGGLLTLATGGGTRRTEHHPPPRAGDALGAFLDQLLGRDVWTPPSPADILHTARVLATDPPGRRSARGEQYLHPRTNVLYLFTRTIE
ncbi:Gfo/Idh/MocA family protein [Streptomyces inusitatus]|uniref:Gfo/Idh/MocA family protein n=1 Tax=Streptomyces inusitatus TaxID=68221 RepID=UPI00167EE593|nr:Gfo/Idh/MocA family oxidoreductase [Streptomyces inusitatus]